MTEQACPFCGKPHPALIDEDNDPGAEPDCDHWIGRWDVESGFEHRLELLNDLELPAYDLEDELGPEVVHDTFGELADLARMVHGEDLRTEGSAAGLLQGLERRLGIQRITLSGDSVMGWSYTDFFAADPDEAVRRIMGAAEALRDGMARLNNPTSESA